MKASTGYPTMGRNGGHQVITLKNGIGKAALVKYAFTITLSTRSGTMKSNYSKWFGPLAPELIRLFTLLL